MTSTVTSNVKAAALIALAVAIGAMGIYVRHADAAAACNFRVQTVRPDHRVRTGTRLSGSIRSDHLGLRATCLQGQRDTRLDGRCRFSDLGTSYE
jgi:hypothetical protein